MGSERTRCPVASKMAFPTAGAIPMMGHSPARRTADPCGPLAASGRAKTIPRPESEAPLPSPSGRFRSPDFIARKHLGGVAGIPDIDAEWPQPFCAAQGGRRLGICATQKRQQPLDLVSLGKLDLVVGQENLQVFLDGLLAMEADDLRRRVLLATSGARRSAASRSASAFSIHSRNRDSRPGSSGFINDAPILVSRVRNAADPALRLFKAFRSHHDERPPGIRRRHSVANLHSPLVSVRQRRFDYQQVDVGCPWSSAPWQRNQTE